MSFNVGIRLVRSVSMLWRLSLCFLSSYSRSFILYWRENFVSPAFGSCNLMFANLGKSLSEIHVSLKILPYLALIKRLLMHLLSSLRLRDYLLSSFTTKGLPVHFLYDQGITLSLPLRPRDYLISSLTTKGLPYLFPYDQGITCSLPLRPRDYLLSSLTTKGLPALFPYHQRITCSLPLRPRDYQLSSLTTKVLQYFVSSIVQTDILLW